MTRSCGFDEAGETFVRSVVSGSVVARGRRYSEVLTVCRSRAARPKRKPKRTGRRDLVPRSAVNAVEALRK